MPARGLNFWRPCMGLVLIVRRIFPRFLVLLPASRLLTRFVPGRFEPRATSPNGPLELVASDDQGTSWTHWPCLGLLGASNAYGMNKPNRKTAILEAQNIHWVTEALARTMPEEHPGQHSLMALEMRSDWASQAGLLVRLFLLSNNFALSDSGLSYDSRFHCDPLHDTQVSILVEQIVSTGSKSLESFLSTDGAVSEAIKAKLFRWSLRCGRDDMLGILLSLPGCGLDQELTDGSFKTAAFVQDKRASARTIRTLLDYGVEKVDNSGIRSALTITIAMDNQEAIDMLIEAGVCFRLSSLIAAVRAGNAEMVRKVLDTEPGIDINEEIAPTTIWGLHQWAALSHAAHRGHLQIVQMLIERGADVNAVHEWRKPEWVSWIHVRRPRTTVLGIAVAAEQVETVRYLAQNTKTRAAVARSGKMPAPNHAEDFICSPLLIACLAGNTEILRLLLLDSSRADVSSADYIPACFLEEKERGKFVESHHPETLLELLILRQDTVNGEHQLVDVCKMLIARGARVDRALVAAAQKERNEVAELLLRHGPSLGLPSRARATAFGFAIEMGNLSLAKMLHEAGATETGYLRDVKGTGMAQFLDGLGLLDVILREYGWVILNKAIEGGEESRWLADRIVLGTDLDFRGKSCGGFLAAVLSHTHLDVDFVKAMVDRGAASTKFELFQAIKAAIEAEASDDIIHFLLAEYVRVVGGSRTPSRDPEDNLSDALGVLLSTARSGSAGVLRIVLDAINWEPDDLRVALNHAIYHSNYGIIQGLLDAGASLGRHKFSGWHLEAESPLETAVQHEQEWLVKILLAAGADVGDHHALAAATTRGNLALVEILLGAGADPTGPTAPERGELTALQNASRLGFLGIARRLIDAGANINAPGRVCDWVGSPQNGLELTALTLASLNGRLETLHLLLSRGVAIHGAARGQYIDAVRAADLNSHRAAAALLKSYGGWTDSDEQSLENKHNTAIAAAEAHWARYVSDEAHCSQNGQTCCTEVDSASTELVGPELRSETQDSYWLQSWEEELGWVDGDVTEYGDFFSEELRWLSGEAAETLL